MVSLQILIFLSSFSSALALLQQFNLSPLTTFALFTARTAAVFYFCAMMTDVNHAVLNGPPSPLLTSDISHSLVPILREPGMDVSISAGRPSRLAVP